MIVKVLVVKGANGFGLRLKESDTGFQTIIHLDDGGERILRGEEITYCARTTNSILLRLTPALTDPGIADI